MAHGDCYCPADLEALHQDWNRSETTICLPSPSAAKRTSTYYPKAGPKAIEESNPDPFYLEQSLAATATDSHEPAIRDDRFSEHNDQFYTPSLTNQKNLSSTHNGSLARPDRSTLTKLESENNVRFHRYTSSSSSEERKPLHSSQDSFSSVQTDSSTPDLTPSSSFSSAHSHPVCADVVLKATEQLYHHAHKTHSKPRTRVYLPPSTPPKYSHPPPPPFAPADTRPTTPTSVPSNNSTTTITMRYEDTATSSSSCRRKAHPTLPNLARGTSNHSSRRKQSSPGTRPPLDPSMISPPCLVNPVTMEPHMTHFDQALFIPATDCPSPVPSPVGSFPPISRQWTGNSMERPSTSTMDPYCEQSVWESDSDTQSIGRKSISRKPIDTLRKVRSRAKLRAAKSQPKLHQAMVDDQALEKFPGLPDDSLSEPCPEPFRGGSIDPNMSRDAMRPNGLQTLRLVAPSTTSLIRPRSRNNSCVRETEFDRSTGVAFQARNRRRQRSDSPEGPASSLSDKEHLTSFCYEKHSPTTLPDPPRPLFQRFWESLRSLNCQKCTSQSKSKSNSN